MAGIYIPGVEIPKCESETGRGFITITISGKGRVTGNAAHTDSFCGYLNYKDMGKAIPVQGHGSLIEKNAVFELIQSMPSVNKLLPVEFMTALYNLPTVITADMEDE